MMFPPVGLADIIATYGDPRWYMDAPESWERKILVIVPVPEPLFLFAGHPVRSLRCHAKAADSFKAAIAGIVDCGLSLIEYGGTYNFRIKRTNAAHISTHAWGIAIDLNASRCPLGADPSKQDPEIVAAFKAAGFTWGGDFNGTKDGMHFQLCAGY